MNLPFFIAGRLKLVSPQSRRSAVSVKVATVGVALSITVMLLTLAIVRGFKQQITEKIIGFDSELTLTQAAQGRNGETPLTFSDDLRDIIASALPEKAQITPAIVQPAVLKTENDFSTVIFRAYGENKDRSFLRDCLTEGSLPDFNSEEGRNDIVLSSTVADALGLKTGDKINSCFFINDKIKVRRYRIAAIYESNFGEYDKVIAFCSMATLRHLTGMSEDQCGRIEISGLPLETIPEAQQNLSKSLTVSYYEGRLNDYMNTTSVLTTGAVYFSWLELLDTNVVIILILMGAISVFTLISSLFILILERVQTIGILKSVGASDSMIRKIFIIMSLRIALRGMLAGNIVGLGLIALQYFFRIVPLDPEAYYISFVPVNITIQEVLILNIASLALALAAMVIPSRIIGKMQTAQIIRYE